MFGGISSASCAASPARPRRQASYRATIESTDLESIRSQFATILATHRPVTAPFYAMAECEAAELAERHGVSHRTAAGVIAALSPTCHWDRNLKLADDMLATGDCRHRSGDAIRKARAIANGAAPLTILRGRKVRSFYRNIVAPYGTGYATIDRHMITGATGRKHSDTGDDSKWLEAPGRYQLVAGVLRSVARAQGVPVDRAQEIIWEAIRTA